MRVNPDQNSGMLTALNRVNQSLTSVLRQLSSGKKIEVPSDNPAGLAALVTVQTADASATQYLSTLKVVRSQMQAADSSLNSVMIAVERALSLGVRGGTGTMTDNDRAAVAAELDGIGDQFLELANSASQGIYLFSGTATTTKPFEKSGTDVSYQGSVNTNVVAISESYSIRSSLSGTAIFGDDTTGLFASIKNLSTTVRSGGDVTSAIAGVRAVRDQISTARVMYGNSLNQVDSAERVLNERHLQLTQQETEIAGVDIADAATRLASAQTARSALLATIGKTDQLNLFDHLR